MQPPTQKSCNLSFSDSAAYRMRPENVTARTSCYGVLRYWTGTKFLREEGARLQGLGGSDAILFL